MHDFVDQMNYLFLGSNPVVTCTAVILYEVLETEKQQAIQLFDNILMTYSLWM